MKGKKRMAVGSVLIIGQIASIIGGILGASSATGKFSVIGINFASHIFLIIIGIALFLWGKYASTH